MFLGYLFTLPKSRVAITSTAFYPIDFSKIIVELTLGYPQITPSNNHIHITFIYVNVF